MSRVVCILAVVLLSACGHLTIAPKPVEARAVAFDGSTQNAGILDYDSAGLIVTPGWIAKYDALLQAYGKKLAADNQVPVGSRVGVTSKGANFHVTWEVQNRFADLKFFERNSAP